MLTGMPWCGTRSPGWSCGPRSLSLIVAFALVAMMLALCVSQAARNARVAGADPADRARRCSGSSPCRGSSSTCSTAVISSIVIGVGIDYAIHFVAAIDLRARDGAGYVFRAIDRAGRPIVANALGIAIALTALWLSPLKIHSQVSMIMWVAMTVAALTALTVIPALLDRSGVESPSVDV